MRTWLGYAKREQNDRMIDLNPAQVLALGFSGIILLGALLLDLPIASKSFESVGFINALFTATSAVCVTGLVVVDTATHWTLFGQSVILILIQIGGLGFMTMATMFALVVGKKISLKSRLVMQEALSHQNISGVVRVTINVLIMTFSLEALGAILLSTRFIPEFGFGRGLFLSIFHSVSAFCNAGFDLMGNFTSLTAYVADPVVNFTVMGLIVTGGLGFTILSDIVTKRDFKTLQLNTKLAVTVTTVLIAIGTAFFFLVEYSNPDTLGHLSLLEKLQAALFQSITPRTAGFNTLPTDKLTMSSLLMTMVLMFIGGSPASTAGGIKTTTFGLIIFNIGSVIGGYEETVMFKRRVSQILISRALALMSLALALVIMVTMILSFNERDLGFMELLFETVSAFGTVGLSTGITSSLNDVSKLVIAVTMFFGRLGPMTLVMALARRQSMNRALVRYPESKVNVG
ncbi:TrkH family potassium uptake protein [Acidaminobacter hydrogenoformans]|uniref:Trk system potassium uptake protein TrkH n=1 Tax=Acidaminobacter hydrogenoformans DSM 2784 TaxID=1120920 RepID=A0A1G5RTY2_9FIRM|nr:TrkH family potassium uptake protein [Acidaminobacter hydrogenoformans]SCZ77575.1 trk system potassium uptake protein TrkH [Acidaminobacter hydrogenoformans DSM 2784]